MFLTVKQKILLTLLEYSQLQNNEIAKHVGITEQWCSKTLATLHMEGLIESELKPPRKINKLTKKGAEIAKSLKEISQKQRQKYLDTLLLRMQLFQLFQHPNPINRPLKKQTQPAKGAYGHTRKTKQKLTQPKSLVQPLANANRPA